MAMEDRLKRYKNVVFCIVNVNIVLYIIIMCAMICDL